MLTEEEQYENLVETLNRLEDALARRIHIPGTTHFHGFDEEGGLQARLDVIESKLNRLMPLADLIEGLGGDDGEPLSLAKLIRMLVSAGKGG